jgi:hypothetical protein
MHHAVSQSSKVPKAQRSPAQLMRRCRRVSLVAVQRLRTVPGVTGLCASSGRLPLHCPRLCNAMRSAGRKRWSRQHKRHHGCFTRLTQAVLCSSAPAILVCHCMS